jgi:hypothetical protein
MNAETALPREVLEAPFPAELIKTRPGAYGGSLSYLEGHTIIARLNEAFDSQWSFEIASHQVLEEEVLVCGKFKAEGAGVIKMAFGSSKITRDKQTGNAVALGDDLKAATTDALKKAATLLGVGLYLYSSSNGGQAQTDDSRPFDEELRNPQPGPNNGQNKPIVSPGGGNGNGRITNRQISAVFSIARQKGMTNEEVRSLCRENYNRNIDYLSKSEASKLIEHLLDR